MGRDYVSQVQDFSCKMKEWERETDNSESRTQSEFAILQATKPKDSYMGEFGGRTERGKLHNYSL